MSYKTIDGLMKHLRTNNIYIAGSTQKQQLINAGYFHGYKGYRFFKVSSRRIPFSKYSDINATIKYDSDLKELFYGKLMFIETAVKNIALNRILIDANSENIQTVFQKVVAGYNSFPIGTDEATRKKAQKNKLNLESRIQSSILKAYTNENPLITHFYNTTGYNAVPLWALFEILTLGDFAYLLQCLDFSTRDHITNDLNMTAITLDSNRELIYKYLYVLKDLRNAVAHNAVVFDTRFSKFDASKAMKKCIQQEFGFPNPISFQVVEDYVILICYYLKHLNVSKKEIKTFLNAFLRITDSYVRTVDKSVSNIVIHPDLFNRINMIKNTI